MGPSSGPCGLRQRGKPLRLTKPHNTRSGFELC